MYFIKIGSEQNAVLEVEYDTWKFNVREKGSIVLFLEVYWYTMCHIDCGFWLI